MASCRLRAYNNSLKPTSPDFGLRGGFGQNCHNVSADIGFRCLQFDDATLKKFNSRLVVPT